MYEINGETFSESQIKELAALEGLSFSAYLAKNNAKVMQYNIKAEEKPEIVKEEEPVVTEENEVKLDLDEKYKYTEFIKPVTTQDGSEDNKEWKYSLEGKNHWLNNWDNNETYGFNYITGTDKTKPEEGQRILMDPTQSITGFVEQAMDFSNEYLGTNFSTDREDDTQAILEDPEMSANVDYGIYLGGQYQETFELNKEIGRLLYDNKIPRQSVQNEDGSYNIPNNILSQAQQNVILKNVEVAETYTSVPAQKASEINRNLQTLRDQLTLAQLKGAPQSEQQEILKQISAYKNQLKEIRDKELVNFDDNGVPNQWYDPTQGKIIKKSSASPEDINEEAAQSAEAMSVWGDSSLEQMYTAENKLINEVAYLGGKLGRFEDEESAFAKQRKSNMAGGGLVPGLKFSTKRDLLSIKYNQKLSELKIVQRAIALNYKPSDIRDNVARYEKSNFIDIFSQDFLTRVSDINEKLGGSGFKFEDEQMRNRRVALEFNKFAREKLGDEKAADVEKKFRLGTIEQTTGEGLIDFAQIALEFALTRKAIGPEKIRRLEEFFKFGIQNSKRLGKLSKPIANFTTSILTEAAIIEARNKAVEPFGGERMSPLFALGAGGTGSLLKGIGFNLVKAPSYTKLMYGIKNGSETARMLLGGLIKPTIGTGVMTAGQLGETILAGHTLDADGDGDIDALQTDNLISTWMMVAALGTANLGKGVQNLKRAIRNDVAFYRGEINSTASSGARVLGLNNELKQKVEDQNGFEVSKLTEQEVDDKFNALMKEEGLDKEVLTKKQQKRANELLKARMQVKRALKIQELESAMKAEGGEQLIADIEGIKRLFSSGQEIPNELIMRSLNVPDMGRIATILLDPSGSMTNRSRSKLLNRLNLYHQGIKFARMKGARDGSKQMSRLMDMYKNLADLQAQYLKLNPDAAKSDTIEIKPDNPIGKAYEAQLENINKYANEQAANVRKSLKQNLLDTYGDGVDLNNINYISLTSKEYNKRFPGGEGDQALFTPMVDKNGKATVYINEDYAYKTQATSLDVHEITHGVFDSELQKMSKAKKKQFATEFFKALPASVKETVSDILLSRVEFKRQENESVDQAMNRVFGSKEGAKELVATTSEVLAGGTFASKNSFKNAGEKISILMESNTPFKNLDFSKGADAFEFIKRFSQGVATGRTAPEVKARVEEMLKEQGDSGISRSNKELDAIVGGKRDGVYSISNEAWKRKSESVVRDLLSTKDNNIKDIFNKYIGSKIGVSNLKAGKEAFMKEVRSKLAKDIENFNPEQNNNFSGYIMQRIIFRKGDALKGEFGAKKGIEISLDTAPEETSREIKSLQSDFISPEEATDIALEKQRREKAAVQQEPKTITENVGLPKEVEINGETKSSLDYVKDVTLKIRFDKLSDISADIGPNQSISNFLRDVRKQIVQSREIKEGPIYKSMGTGKNLENYYNKNFEKIVKNIQSSYFSDIMSREFNKKGSTTLPRTMIQKSVGGITQRDASGKIIGFVPRYTTDWFGKKTDKMIKSLHGTTSQPEFIRLNPEFDFTSAENKKAFFESFKSQTRKQGIAGQLMGKAVLEQILESSQKNDAINQRLKDLTELSGREIDSDFTKKLKSQIASAEISRSTKQITDLSNEDFYKYQVHYSPFIVKALRSVGLDDKDKLKTAIHQALKQGDIASGKANAAVIDGQTKSFRNKKGEISITFAGSLVEAFTKLEKNYDKSFNPDLNSKVEFVIEKNALANAEKTLARVTGTEGLNKSEYGAKESTVIRQRELARDYLEEKILEDVENGKSLEQALQDRIALAMRTGNNHYDASKLADGGYIDAATGDIVLDPKGTNRFNYFGNKVDFASMLNKIAEGFGFTTYLDFNFYEDRRLKKSAKDRVFKTGIVGPTDLELRQGGVEMLGYNEKTGKYETIDVPLTSEKGKTRVSKDGEADFTEKQLQDSRDTAIEARKELTSQMAWYTEQLKKGNISNKDFAIWQMSLKSSMGSILRTAAPVGWIFEGSIKGKKVLETRKGKEVLVDDYFVFEHMKPAEFMLTEMTKIFFDKNNLVDGKLTKTGEAAVKELFSDYEVAIIPKSMDNVLKAFGLTEKMPLGDFRALQRYYNELTRRHPDLRSLRGVGKNKGKIEGREFLKVAEAENTKEIIDFNASENTISKSTKKTNFEILKELSDNDKAIANAKKTNKKIKKIRVFDFDDTLATSKNIVTAKRGNEEIKLNAEEFAQRGLQLKEQGYIMDFSDFNKVTDGGRGPLFEVAKTIKEARGNEDLFVLTARAPEAADAIYDFLKAEGLEFKRDNIIGLGNSTGEAKAQWLVGKAAEGYNDFYFADDALANVNAVKKAISVLDVKSKIQQALSRSTKDLDTDLNKILENKSGIEYYKEYSSAKAKTVGANKGKGKFWIPYSAEDITGLIYKTLGKGKIGDKQMAWWKQNFLNPYSRAMDNLSRDRVQLMSDFKALKKVLDVPKDLRKKNSTGFTNEQAVRVYLFEKTGQEAPGLSKTDKAELLDVVNKSEKLKAFAEQILSITKGDGYATPRQGWLTGTITTDLMDLISTTKRSKYLQEWKENTDIIFSEKNLNKMEAIYGSKYREAMENSLTRMKSGRNRVSESSKLSNQILDFINGSNATIMFFNTRSSILQTISSLNYVNWSFNNPLKAGAAFANQPQYWKDFMELINSDYLKDRRNGLRLNISESEIADAAKTSKNRAKAVMSYILEKGYLPTQFADSFAIAAGGATYYRNRINDLRKNKGLTEAKAKEIAKLEWRQLSEESQQSSNPSKISQQQASDAGRLILMFANTPMQYARLQKRAFQDLINRRGDAKTNMSKIVYYTFVQNVIFNAMQQALFKIGFDEDDQKKEKAYYRTANGMLDSQLRGLGFGGQALSVAKNFLLDIYERSGRKRPEYVDAAWKLMQFSPPIGSKISKLRSAAYAFDSKKRREEIYSKGFSLDNPAAMAGARVISATTNFPLDRVLQKKDNIEAAMSEETDFTQDLALFGGWPAWQIVDKEKEIVLSYEDRVKSSNYKEVSKLSKSEQVDILKKAGYSDEAIKSLKTERDRVSIIIKSNKKKYPGNELIGYDQYDKERKALIDQYRKSTNVDELKELNKFEQVQILKDLGYSDQAIRSLKTEADRVKVIARRNK